MGRRALLLSLATLVGCSTILYGRTSSAPAPAGARGAGLPRVEPPRPDADRLIRVAIRTSANTVRISSTGGWRFYEADGQTFLAAGNANEPWRVEHAGRDVRAVRSDGMPTAWKADAIVAAPNDPADAMLVDGKPYRGTLRLVGADAGIVVIETVGVEQYLRGVVPLELGDNDPRDSSAIEAQAVAARSYTYTHLAEPEADAYDVTASVDDQVYGGLDAETAAGNAAVAATAGIVITYGGRVVNAPYHSTCGGETAAASEVWHSPDEPYLRPVSDRIPGTDRYYCEISPRFRWRRVLSASDLNGAVARYLARYASVPGGDPGLVRDVMVVNRTESGRVGQLRVVTNLGSFVLRGNDMRYVLRPVGGEILNSTYFSVAVERNRAGDLARLVLDGRGNGHGVGMCQWGAIGRARAGQGFRTILRTYYPGTALGVVQ
ncbi:MAG: SpoIID/LytB domain-containing protein [Gemmatimonadota bacterium]|nr:SpoIID/LytB domain-containing protein [Gemmatimonadota bacterium]MDE3216428.1 SpoIID/LytB domain-containing protein [Gemmatimonadota bacterium]